MARRAGEATGTADAAAEQVVANKLRSLKPAAGRMAGDGVASLENCARRRRHALSMSWRVMFNPTVVLAARPTKSLTKFRRHLPPFELM